VDITGEGLLQQKRGKKHEFALFLPTDMRQTDVLIKHLLTNGPIDFMETH